jgi:hypothetical protein
MGKRLIILKKAVQQTGKENTKERLKWLKRFGFVGFLFFFIKGLIWIAVFLGLGKVFGNLF